MIPKKIIIFIIIVLKLSSAPAFSVETEKSVLESEIEFLLNEVEKTDCKLIRNGKEYNGEKAALHINRKYRHFKKRIKTTEDFIEYSADKSIISGKFYFIQCPNRPKIRCSKWLSLKLQKLRKPDQVLP